MEFKKIFFKYFQFWPWIMASLILCVGPAFYFIKTVAPTYQSSALIKIDKNQGEDLKLNTFSKENVEKKEVDLNDEIQLVTSDNLLSQVVDSLKLNINYFEKGYLQDKIINDAPFVINMIVSNDSIHKAKYNIKIVKEGFIIADPVLEKNYLIRDHSSSRDFSGLPFSIQLSSKAKQNLSSYLDKEFAVSMEPTALAVINLKSELTVKASAIENTNLILTHEGANPERSIKILDELIVLLDKNIVYNKQKSLNKIVSYLTQRIAVFSKEKESIESAKEKYLQNNNILVMDRYVADKTNEKNLKEESSMLNNRQIALTKFAINDIKNTKSNSTLGTGYSLETANFNQLLLNYNASILESELVLQRAQKNNPTYLNLVLQLKMQKQAILNTLDGYLNVLNQNNVANLSAQNSANLEANSIPTKDKILGNINNKINLKDETYSALLQKREEAIMNRAALESNLKILNPSQTNYLAVFPQPKSFMIGALMFGLVLPLGMIYFKLHLDTTIHNEEDIHEVFSQIPFLGIIPEVHNNEKLDNTARSRSTIAEATRIVVSNISYLQPQKSNNKGNVILFCSSIQSEGKSFCAFHNAISISNLNKKVLLIGADLRNPQLHDYFNVDKSISGLTNFLSNKSDGWKEFLVKETNFSKNLDTLFSGEIPPNPSQLLTNTNFELLIQEAKELYDFIIIDSAPVQLVSDTLTFSYLADVTVFVTRYDYTEKGSLVQLNNFIKKEQLKNVGIIINRVSRKSAYGYNYGYSYSYQYEKQDIKKPWLKRILS
jgi:capsular exopolysaccharide synthesis family protein